MDVLLSRRCLPETADDDDEEDLLLVRGLSMAKVGANSGLKVKDSLDLLRLLDSLRLLDFLPSSLFLLLLRERSFVLLSLSFRRLLRSLFFVFFLRSLRFPVLAGVSTVGFLRKLARGESKFQTSISANEPPNTSSQVLVDPKGKLCDPGLLKENRNELPLLSSTSATMMKMKLLKVLR